MQWAMPRLMWMYEHHIHTGATAATTTNTWHSQNQMNYGSMAFRLHFMLTAYTMYMLFCHFFRSLIFVCSAHTVQCSLFSIHKGQITFLYIVYSCVFAYTNFILSPHLAWYVCLHARMLDICMSHRIIFISFVLVMLRLFGSFMNFVNYWAVFVVIRNIFV